MARWGPVFIVAIQAVSIALIATKTWHHCAWVAAGALAIVMTVVNLQDAKWEK